MSSEWELDEGIKSVKSAWRREHTARANLEKMLEQAEAENEQLRKLVRFIMHQCNDGNPRCDECIEWNGGECVALLRMRELGIGVDL